MMNNRSLTILGAITMVLVIWSIILASSRPGGEIAFLKGRDLLAPYDRDRIAGVRVAKEGKEVRLSAQNKGFVVTTRMNYPANTAKVWKLVADLDAIRCATEVSKSKDSHAELGVDGGKESTTIQIFDANGKDIVGVIVGKSDDQLRGNYVRMTNSDTVYVSTEFLSFDTEALDYLDKQILKIEEKDIAEAQVKGKERRAYTIKSPKEGEKELVGVDPKYKPKDYEIGAVFSAATDLSFDDFQPESKVADLKFDTTYTVTKRLQPSYDLFIAKKDDKYYVKCKAVWRGPDIQKVLAAPKPDTPKEELDRKDKLIEGAKAIDVFNNRHKGWVYEISSWNAGNMTKKYDDLVEEVITASHILVSYEGAEKSEVKDRTKEQAKKIADDLLPKVKAAPDKFADFAKEHSDGPTKEEGGDLGEFNRDKMSKPFTEAAFKLKPGEISDVVETEFGFHIIKRTK